MAVHEFTGVTARIQYNTGAGATTLGFVSGDFSLSVATGKYVTIGNAYATKNTRGLRSVSGSLSLAWGIDDAALYALFTADTEFDLIFDNDGATGAHTYTLSNCVLTELSVEGIEAGSEGALMINASFEALTWSRD
tara:strand:+ start:935 stop:1342 length:408 start_codon:yes stop_codon:yes gene_type:complete